MKKHGSSFIYSHASVADQHSSICTFISYFTLFLYNNKIGTSFPRFKKFSCAFFHHSFLCIFIPFLLQSNPVVECMLGCTLLFLKPLTSRTLYWRISMCRGIKYDLFAQVYGKVSMVWFLVNHEFLNFSQRMVKVFLFSFSLSFNNRPSIFSISF